MKVRKIKTQREPRTPLPDASRRVAKIAYFEPELAADAHERADGLGVSFSKYLCDLVRRDLGAGTSGSGPTSTSEE